MPSRWAAIGAHRRVSSAPDSAEMSVFLMSSAVGYMWLFGDFTRQRV